ncbi:MAG TPA: ABC transporter ATP-binding protein [bacterium]|nr:ABC transporter ATP-binding protein [bacterium]
MSDIVISVEHLTKEYRIGAITHRTFQRDLQSWWARMRGKDDPNLPVDGGRRKKLEALADENGIIHALNDVSFEVKQGEVLGIIGRNGAGKSTLLKILSRVTAPTSGCVKIKGRIGSLLEVGTGFHPELTGRENIYMNGAILGMKKREIDRNLDEIIDFSGVEQFIDTPVKRYSSGMYVRLAFAVAAHLDPEILVVDEVLAVGDAEFQKKCLGKMDDVSKKEGRTVFFVSHNMSAIRQICSRGILIYNGSLACDSECAEVVARYLYSASGGKNANSEPSIGRKWSSTNRPFAKILEICSIVAESEKGEQLVKIDSDTPFCLVIDYNILKERSYAAFTFVFHDSELNCAFSAISNHESTYYNKPMNIGSYRTRCHIPGMFLNADRYSVSINVLTRNYRQLLSLPHFLTINIDDGLGVRGDYTHGYSGSVRPFLQWHTERCTP